MEYINSSLKKALIKDSWHLGDKAGRIGHPFTWADTGSKPLITSLDPYDSLLHFFCMYYVKKKTPKYILTSKYVSYYKKISKTFNDSWDFFFKNLRVKKINFIESQSTARAQDLSFIKKYSKLKKNINYLDVGPGIGGMYPTLKNEYNIKYYGVEAVPMTYFVQKMFLNYLASKENSNVLDVCELEKYLNILEIKKKIKKSKICLVPSWHFNLIRDNSIDLVSAMFMLNELTYAGIFHVFSNIVSKLKLGGYLYIRDSHILKPGCHNFNYDEALKDFGFKTVAFYKIPNRLDFFGIPRLYKKHTIKKITFDILIKKYLGKYTSVASGYEKSYNWKKK
jgi:hypothetical protein